MPSRKQKTKEYNLPEIKKEFMDTFDEMVGKYSRRELWRDFLKTSAIALVQSCDYSHDRENDYLSTIKKYEREEVHKFVELFGLTRIALSKSIEDFLGDMYLKLEINNKANGQFFTPQHVCDLMASISISPDDVEKNNNTNICEPCAGSGNIIIGTCKHLINNNVDYRNKVDVVAWDNDIIAFHMCYIQLELLECPARVVFGDTIKDNIWDIWPTHQWLINNNMVNSKYNKKFIELNINL